MAVSNRDPADYLEEFDRRKPGVIESHWIPMDRNLWKVENYRDFLAARRELLAKAANAFLDNLFAGSVPDVPVASLIDEYPGIPPMGVPLGSIATEAEEQVILECAEWIMEQGLPEGELMYELTHPQDGQVLAVLDLAWPDGLQQGLSRPVALLIDEDPEIEKVVNREGFLYFTNPDTFREYVRREILAEVIA